MTQQVIFEKQIKAHIEANLDYYMRLYFKEYLAPEKLKVGKTNCPCCGKLMRAYCKSLDDRLVKLAWDILIWRKEHKSKMFKFKEIWGEDYQTILDAQKLSYFGIIKRIKGTSKWGMTRQGLNFLKGDIQLPRRVWIFNRRVILEDELMTRVDNPDPRWQTYRSSYTLDYVPKKYILNPKLL